MVRVEEVVDDVAEQNSAAFVGNREQFERRCGAQAAEVAVRIAVAFESVRSRLSTCLVDSTFGRLERSGALSLESTSSSSSSSSSSSWGVSGGDEACGD